MSKLYPQKSMFQARLTEWEHNVTTPDIAAVNTIYFYDCQAFNPVIKLRVKGVGQQSVLIWNLFVFKLLFPPILLQLDLLR